MDNAREAQLAAFQKLMLDIHGLCSFTLSNDGALLNSNCTEQMLFFQLLELSGCLATIRKHFAGHEEPVIVTDSTGLVWLCIHCDNFYLLGPFFTTENSPSALRQSHLDGNIAKAVLQNLSCVASVSYSFAVSYANILSYCVSGKAYTQDQIVFVLLQSNSEQTVELFDAVSHSTQNLEKILFNSIKEGDLKGLQTLLSQHMNTEIGQMSKDYLRQHKYTGIAMAMGASRAAADGGMSYDGALNLSDYYCQLIDCSETPNKVRFYIAEMLEAFARRVMQCRKAASQSQIVRTVQEYIRTHVTERIDLEDMAVILGYSKYYLSVRYLQESRERIGQTIKREKIEKASALLKDTQMSSAEIADLLGFSSHSYFHTSFKEIKGTSPGAYRKQLYQDGVES